MIVVIGQPILRLTADGPRAAGIAATVGAEAARRGTTVQLIGKVGEDRAGEDVVLALAREGVGHVALLRDASRSTPVFADVDEAGVTDATDVVDVPLDDDAAAPPGERIEPADRSAWPQLDAADLDLGLRYLTEFRVLVVTEPLDEEAARVVADATGWSGAALIALAGANGRVPGALPAGAIVLEAPPSDPDGAFARFVGALAAAIDGGTEPAAAFREVVDTQGWEPAGA